jgi:hypothetical protein
MTHETQDARTYWQRLKDHPGGPWVVFWAISGLFIAGREDWRKGVIAVALMLLIFGPIVLWTARK